MPPKRRILMAIVLVLLLVLAAVAVFHREFFPNRNRSLDSLTLYGNIDLREVQLAFHDTGRIQKLLFLEGTEVRSGELMGIMDPVRYDDLVNVDLALLAKDRVERANAERTWRRVVKLAHVNFNSKQKLDDARAALDSAKAEVQRAKAQLSFDRRQQADTRIYSPVDGIVQNRVLEPGDMAFPQSPVYTIARLKPLWARVYVEEPELGRVHQGMEAVVTTDSFPGKEYRGYVGYISPTAEFTPKQVETLHQRTILVYRVRVYLHCPTTELRLGMPVTVTIPLNRKPSDPTACPDGSPPGQGHGE